MTLKEMIARIKRIAQETAPGPVRPLLNDSKILVELILPKCMDAVADKIARTPDGLNALRGNIDVVFVAGVVDFPDTIKESHIDTISMSDDPMASHLSSWIDYQMRPTPPKDCARFTVKAGKLYYTPLGGTKTSFSGTRTLSAVLRPQLPTLVTDQVTIRESILNELIVFTASVVNGSTPLREIGLDYTSLEVVRKAAESSV